MNPMENESVVAELLRIADGALELEDPRKRMEGLIARPGWSTWKVMRDNRTRKAMKNWKKKNNAKMMEKRKQWEEKRLKEEKGYLPPRTAKLDENHNKGDDKDEKYVPQDRSPFETIPYIPPSTWDDEALSERTTSLGFVGMSTRVMRNFSVIYEAPIPRFTIL